MPYDPTIYLGSAAHYRDGRPAYSPQLEALLTHQVGLDGNGRLLDTGCGPGVLTVRLAGLFEQVVAAARQRERAVRIPVPVLIGAASVR